MKFRFAPHALFIAAIHTAPAALTGHWTFNEGTGTAASNAANPAYPGTLVNFSSGAEWTAGPTGGGSAINADGIDDIVTTTSAGIAGNAVRSVTAWIKYPAQSDAELDGIFSYGANTTGNRWTVRIGSGAGADVNRLRLEISGSGVYGSTNLNDDQWHHVAVVQSGPSIGTVLLYVDGVAESLAYNGSGSTAAINTSSPAGQEIAVAGSRHATNYNFKGAIDDVRFYDHALTPVEIQALVANPPAITSFTALPGNLTNPGQQAILSWKGTALPAATWTITPGPVDVTSLTSSGSGTLAVSPATTTVYTLTVSDAHGTANSSTNVGVNEPQAHLQINEVMAANDGVLLDEDGDAPDWIELRNPNGFAVSAAGYRLRDGGGSDWVIPGGVYLAGGGHLRLFASGKNRTNPAANLHTNFSLSAGGESLTLLAPGGTTTADSMPGTVVFPDNVTWGRISDGSSAGYLATPTPGTANSAAGNPGPRIDSVTTSLPGDAVKPRRPALEGGETVADSIDQFSSTQGQDGWRYGWFPGAITAYGTAGFTEFPRDALQSAWSATNNFNAGNTQWGPSWERATGATTPLTDLGSDYTHPAVTGGVNCAVRRWISSATGPAVITGFFHHVGTSGDGTRWQIFQNGMPLVDSDSATAGSQPHLLKTALHRFAIPVNLTVGDMIDLVCDPNATETGDASRGWFRVQLNPPAENPALHDLTLPVSATLQETSGAISSATLYYRFDYGPEQSAPMIAAGSLYSAEIPLAGIAAGRMVRWRIAATDSAGGLKTSPSYPSPTDSPQYHGTVTVDPDSAAAPGLPVLDLFTSSPAQIITTTGARCSLMWNGVFYDNIQADLHATSSNSWAKKSLDVDFNKGHRFHFVPGDSGHTDCNVLTNWRDRAKLRNPLAYEIFGKAGSPTLHCETVRLQFNGIFHSTADLTGEGCEGSLADNGLDPNGALYKIQNLFNTSPSHATIGSTVEKKTRKWEPGSTDLLALLNGMLSSSTDDDTDPVVNNSPRFRFLCDNTDLAATANWIAAMFFSSSYDWGHKNYMLYRDSDRTGRWQPFPWDLDLSFGHYYDAALNGYFDDAIRTATNDGSVHNFSLYHNQVEFVPPNKNSLFMTFLDDPTLKDMIKRRLRTLAEQFLLASGPAPDFEGRIDQQLALVDPPGAAESDADRDLRIWGYWNQHQSGSFTYISRSAADDAQRIKNTFLPARRGMMFSNNPALGAAYGGPIPGPEIASPQIGFGTFDSNPAGGNQDQEFIEITNGSADYVDLSGWSLAGGVSFTFPPGTVISPPGNTRFNGRLIVAKSASGWNSRAASPKKGEGRFVLLSYDGQLSNRGESVILKDRSGTPAASLVVPANPSALQNGLRITEINYNPAQITPEEAAANPLLTTQDFEFVELMNVSGQPLDVSGCTFTDGISFTFGPAIPPVPAGGRIIVAKNPAAFALRHPAAAVSVFGGYEDNLSNGGETITLREAGGETILSFSYNDRWFKPANSGDPTDGAGHTLVFSDATLPWTAWDDSGNWRISAANLGDPGAGSSVFAWNYQEWQRIYFNAAERTEESISGPDATSASGIKNLVLYALGLPRDAGGAGLPTGALITDGGRQYLSLSFRRLKHPLDVTYTVESADELGTWQPETTSTGPVIDNGDQTETVVIRTTASYSRRFIRLRLTLP